MNRFRWGVIFILVILLSSGLYRLMSENADLKKKIQELEDKFNVIEKENKNLVNQVEYYSHLENLVKELKTRFNYKEAGESLIIIVPPLSVTSSDQKSP